MISNRSRPKAKFTLATQCAQQMASQLIWRLSPANLAQLSGNSEIGVAPSVPTRIMQHTAERMRDRRAWVRLNRGRIVCSFSQSDKTASRISHHNRRDNAQADPVLSVFSLGGARQNKQSNIRARRSERIRRLTPAVEDWCRVFL